MKPNMVAASMVEQVLAGKLSRREALRRAAGLGVSATFASALLAAGGGAAAAQSTSYTPKGPKVDKLVFWTRSSKDTSKNEWDALQGAANAYTKAIGTKIDLVTVPDADFRNKLSLAAPSGNGPDVFGPIAHDWIGEIAYQKIAQVWPSLPDQADFPQESMQLVTLAVGKDGKPAIYALPLFTEALALVYNKDMVSDPPKTWDDLLSKAKDLTKGGNYGFAFQILTQYYEGPFFFAEGSFIFPYANGIFDTTQVGLNNDGGIAASKALRDMYYGKAPEMPEGVLDQTNAGQMLPGMMQAGQLAMTIDGPWSVPSLKDAGIKVGVAPLPTWTNGKPLTPFLGIQAMVVNAYSKQAEAATDFVSFMGSDEQVVPMAVGFNKAPARTSAADAAVKANPDFEAWIAQTKNASPMPNVPAMQQVWTPWGDAMAGILQKKASDDQIKQLLDAAVDQIKKNIAKSQS